MDLVRFIDSVLRPWRNVSFRSGKLEELHPHELGRLGEREAVRYLRKNGYKLLYRNFKPKRGGEIDLVCRDKRAGMLVFVEVKTRRGEEFGSPASAVDSAKRRRLSQGALAWLRMLDNPDVAFRFDIVEVRLQSGILVPNLIQNAFTLSAPYRY